MTIDNILDVVTEFTKRLQLPESKYKFMITSSNEVVELVISVEDDVKISMKITNGNISVLYTDEYNSDQYVAMEFLTPITLLYQISILFYAAVKEVAQIDFNELLSIVLLDDVYDWKTLIHAIAENVNLECEIKDNYVTVEDVEIHYNGFENHIRIDKTDIKLDSTDYTYIVEAMFKCVEYIANIMDVADDLFKVEEEPQDGLLEEGENVAEGGPGGMPSDMDIDVDMEMPPEEGGGEEPAAVEPVETETFEEPQGPVVTMDDLL